MIKAKDFLHFLCEEQDYRFFVGVPSLDFRPIYKNMNSDFMHYIPAVNIDIAVSLAIGSLLGGFKSVVISDNENFDRFRKELIYVTPVLFLLPEKTTASGFLNVDFTNLEDLEKVFKKSFSSNKPVTLGLGGKLE